MENPSVSCKPSVFAVLRPRLADYKWLVLYFIGIGTCFEIGWMTAVAGAYLAFLWLPISPEKIVTVALAMGLLRLLFPNDQKTLAVLKKLYGKIKGKMKKKKPNADH